MIGATFCSGIGAPEMDAPWIDWRFASEIEPFPRAVLQCRLGYKVPEGHNHGDPLLWGDMTTIEPELWREHGLTLPEIIVAGTPCQDFSIAGMRKGLKGPRGNLTMKFVEICHALVDARPDGKLRVLWENVPGVLSIKGNVFGNFISALVGGDDAFPRPNGESWPSAGDRMTYSHIKPITLKLSHGSMIIGDTDGVLTFAIVSEAGKILFSGPIYDDMPDELVDIAITRTSSYPKFRALPPMTP